MIRTRGTGYKYFETPRLPRMSRESFADALRKAQDANNRYKFKSIFVTEFVALYERDCADYWRRVFATLNGGNVQAKFDEYRHCNPEDILDEERRKEARVVLGLIHTLSGLPTKVREVNEDNLSKWREVFAYLKKQGSDQTTSVAALANIAAASILKGETPETLRSRCALKAANLNMNPEVSAALVVACTEILNKLRSNRDER